MTAGTRALAVLGLVAAFAGLFFLCTNHGPSGGVDSPSARVDSLRAVVVHLGDSITLERAAHAHDLDSLQALLQRAPDTVWQLARRLVHDTVNTGRIDTLRLVSRLVLDDSACRVDRDSLRGEVTLWKARDAAHAEAYRLAQERPVVVGDTSPPSRAAWAAVGAAGALVGVTTILLLGR